MSSMPGWAQAAIQGIEGSYRWELYAAGSHHAVYKVPGRSVYNAYMSWRPYVRVHYVLVPRILNLSENWSEIIWEGRLTNAGKARLAAELERYDREALVKGER